MNERSVTVNKFRVYGNLKFHEPNFRGLLGICENRENYAAQKFGRIRFIHAYTSIHDVRTSSWAKYAGRRDAFLSKIYARSCMDREWKGNSEGERKVLELISLQHIESHNKC